MSHELRWLARELPAILLATLLVGLFCFVVLPHVGAYFARQPAEPPPFSSLPPPVPASKLRCERVV